MQLLIPMYLFFVLYAHTHTKFSLVYPGGHGSIFTLNARALGLADAFVAFLVGGFALIPLSLLVL